MTEVSVDQFISNNFIKIQSKIHIEEVRQILINHGYEVDNKNTLLFKKIQNAINEKISMDKNGFIKLFFRPEQLKVREQKFKKEDEFIINHFKNTDYNKDKLHIGNIRQILLDNGYDVGNKITTLFRELELGIYNKNITIDRVKKAGFTNLIYT
jgi:hypothetical protein